MSSPRGRRPSRPSASRFSEAKLKQNLTKPHKTGRFPARRNAASRKLSTGFGKTAAGLPARPRMGTPSTPASVGIAMAVGATDRRDSASPPRQMMRRKSDATRRPHGGCIAGFSPCRRAKRPEARRRATDSAAQVPTIRGNCGDGSSRCDGARRQLGATWLRRRVAAGCHAGAAAHRGRVAAHALPPPRLPSMRCDRVTRSIAADDAHRASARRTRLPS